MWRLTPGGWKLFPVELEGPFPPEVPVHPGEEPVPPKGGWGWINEGGSQPQPRMEPISPHDPESIFGPPSKKPGVCPPQCAKPPGLAVIGLLAFNIGLALYNLTQIPAYIASAIDRCTWTISQITSLTAKVQENCARVSAYCDYLQNWLNQLLGACPMSTYCADQIQKLIGQIELVKQNLTEAVANGDSLRTALANFNCNTGFVSLFAITGFRQSAEKLMAEYNAAYGLADALGGRANELGDQCCPCDVPECGPRRTAPRSGPVLTPHPYQ